MAEVLSEWMNDTVASVDRAVNQSDSTQGSNRAEVVSVLFLVKVLHRAIRILRTEMERGVEPSTFVARYDPTSEALARLLKTFRDLEAKIPQQFRGPVARKLLARMRRVEAEVTNLQAYLAKCLRLAKTPLPRIDMESVRRGREDAAAGRKESSRTIDQRIRAGGDL